MYESKGIFWHPGGEDFWNTPGSVIRMLFGLDPIDKPMGLYQAIGSNKRLDIENKVGGGPLFHPDTGGYVGSIISFRNLDFVIWLSDDDPKAANIPVRSQKLFGPGRESLGYRPGKFEFNSRGMRSGVLTLEWQ